MTNQADRQPFCSIVVPTRDRPEFLRYCLLSLRQQTFLDFEVIVSDNYVSTPAKDVFDEIADSRFRYVTPENPLSMPDNWEFGVSLAAGKYVGVLIDKTVLIPSALQFAQDSVAEKPAQIVSWWNDGYNPFDEASGYDKGSYVPSSIPVP